MRGLMLALALGLGAAPAAARTFENCTAPHRKVADAAFSGAQELAIRAAAAVGDSPVYADWFGAFAPARGEAVRKGMKAIHATLLGDDLVAVCLGVRAPDCEGGTYAFVVFDRQRTIHLCPAFFQMPRMVDAVAGRSSIANGTREGTIIHELSHFPLIAGTGDECYGRVECRDLADADPATAFETADSYQYFAEDVTLAFVRAQR